MRAFVFTLVIMVLVFQVSCSKKEKENRVDIDQLIEDGSISDRYMFRKQISEEKEKKTKELREEFR